MEECTEDKEILLKILPFVDYDKCLIDLSKKGDIKIIKYILTNKKISITSIITGLGNFLEYIGDYKNEEIVDLFTNLINPEEINIWNDYCMDLACETGNIQLVNICLQKCSNTVYCINRGLCYSVKYQNLNLTKLMLSKGADDRNCLIDACRKKNFDIFKLLFDKFFDEITETDISLFFYQTKSFYGQNSKIFEFLINYGELHNLNDPNENRGDIYLYCMTTIYNSVLTLRSESYYKNLEHVIKKGGNFEKKHDLINDEKYRYQSYFSYLLDKMNNQRKIEYIINSLNLPYEL